MKAIVLLATLKAHGKSNTEVLTEFVISHLEKHKISCEVIRLAEHTILPGTYIEIDTPDDFPEIYKKIVDADIILFATPIWWNNHSSELQRVIERLDEVYDYVLEGRGSPLDGKLGGIIVTGDSDGVEHITGNIANFFCSIGITIPAYASLGVIWTGHGKKINTSRARMLEHYEKEYLQDAKAMAKSLASLAGR